MAFETVNPISALWLNTGLRYLIVPPEERQFLKAGPASTAVRSAPGATAHSQAAQQYKPWAAQASAARPAPPRQAAHRPISTSGSQPLSEKNNLQQTQKTAQAAATPFSVIPAANWPGVWQEQFSKTKPGIFAWTYWQLGSDLLSARNADSHDAERTKRSKVLKELLAGLGHPAGTHTFWPPHLDPAAEPKASPEIFWSGVRLLGCRGVIIMGSPAAIPLLQKPGLAPLQRWLHNGVTVWILNDPDRLANDPALLQRMLIFLKNALKPFVRF